MIAVATACSGSLLGLPSRRLAGDYLAIVTLFFGQLFVVFAQRRQDSLLGPRSARRQLDLTGGPNGIADVDPFRIFGEP